MPEINPYAAPVAEVEDAVSETGELATRGDRFSANIVDTIAYALAFVAYILVTYMGGPEVLGGVLAAVIVLALIVVNVYWLNQNAQTLGKRLLRIRVARTDGSKPGLVRLIFGRGLSYWVLSGLRIGLIDALFIFGKSRRCVHDYIADTIVVKN